MDERKKILIFIVSYNSESFIQDVLLRIPDCVWNNDRYISELLIIDDQSSDNTLHRVKEYINSHPDLKIKFFYNPVNQGYGGNQKLGYHYAIKYGFDIVVLLHGDGQYDPKLLDEIIRPIINGEADVVIGSRMVNRLDALKGGMPIYKWIGNQVLTVTQNLLLRSNLSEFHSGYRAYRTQSLEKVPFEFNSNYFDFDTEILIQMIDTSQRIQEIPIPTYYGKEICYVNGLKYGYLILLATLRSRIVNLNLLYDRRFDYESQNSYYTIKLGYFSSHQYALDKVGKGMTVLDIGCGPGYMAEELHKRGINVISIDRCITQMTRQFSSEVIETEIETCNFPSLNVAPDRIFLLDIIEHLNNPEGLLLQIRKTFANQEVPQLIITSGNIGFFIVRFGLLLGQFNYGKKGILDKDHHRLFTFGSMKRLLHIAGYTIKEVKGIPAPFPLAIGNNIISRFLLFVNCLLIRIWPGLFAYQMGFVAVPKPMIEHLLGRAANTGEKILKET